MFGTNEKINIIHNPIQFNKVVEYIPDQNKNKIDTETIVESNMKAPGGSISQVFIDDSDSPVTLSNIYLDTRPPTQVGRGEETRNQIPQYYFSTPSPVNWQGSTTTAPGSTMFSRALFVFTVVCR